MRKDIKKLGPVVIDLVNEVNTIRKLSMGTYIVAIATPLVFLIDMFVMLKFKLKGGDATALCRRYRSTGDGRSRSFSIIFKDSLEKVTEYVREGFLFGIKVFAPVIVIGAFSFWEVKVRLSKYWETTLPVSLTISEYSSLIMFRYRKYLLC